MGNDFKRGIRIYLETSDYGKGIDAMVAATQKYEKELEDLRAEAQKMTAAGQAQGKAWDDLQKQMKRTETQLKKSENAEAEYRSKLKQTESVLNNLSGVSYNELVRVQKQLQKELKDTTRGTDLHKTKLQQLERVNKEVTKAQGEMNSNLGKSPGFFSRAADGFNKYFNVAVTVIASITGASLAFRKLAEDVAKMDDIYSDVMKTTGMTRDEVLALNEEFKKIDTRTAREDLNKIAESGGRIGVAKENILDFTKAMDIANVALGDSFTGGVEEISTKLGKLKNLFAETKDMQIEKAYLSIASSINELGANGAASELNISEFALRIGSLPEALKPSVAETLALGAAFEESGIEAEISGRAYNIFLKQAATESAKFAKVMGITAGEVEDLINTNPMEFFLQFAQGMRGMDATDVAKTLDYLGINADGANKAIGAAANSTDRFRELISMSNKAFTEGTSVLNEFSIKNNNLAAALDKARNKFNETAKELGEKLNPILLTSVKGTTYLVKALVELPKWLKSNWQWIGALAVVMTAYTVSVNRARISAALWYATEKIKVMWTNRATIAQTALNFVMNKNPIAFVITLIMGLVAGFITWYNSSIKVQAATQGLFASIKVMGEKLLAYWTGLWQLISGAATLNPKQIKKSIDSFKKAFTGWGDDLAKAYTDAYNKRMSQGLMTTPKKPKVTTENKTTTTIEETIVTDSPYLTPEGSSGATEDPYDKALKEKEIKYKEFQLEIMELRRTGLISEDEYNKKAIDQQLMFLQEKMNLQLKYGKETIDTEIEISTQKTKLQEDADKAILKSIHDVQESGIVALETANQRKQDMLQESLNNQVITEKEYNREIKKLAVEILTAKIALAEASIKALETADFADKAVKDDAIKKANDDLLKLKSDLLKAQGDVAKDVAKEIEDNTKTVAERMESVFGNSFSNIGNLFTVFTESLNKLKDGDLASWEDWGAAIGSIVQAALSVASEINDQYFEYKANALEADKQRELTAAGDSAEAREAITQKYAEKELELKKKQSSADTVLKVAQSLSAGALAVMQAFAQLGPIGGTVAAIMVGGITALQVANIIKQNEAIQNTTLDSSVSGSTGSATGFGSRVIAAPQAAEGRWDVIGRDDNRIYRNVPYRGVARTGIVTTPTLVGEVGDEAIIDNPTLRNIRMNAPWVLSIIRRLRVPQRAAGNYSEINTEAGNSQLQSSENSRIVAANIEVMQKLITILRIMIDNGIDANIYLDQLEKKIELRNKSVRKGSLK